MLELGEFLREIKIPFYLNLGFYLKVYRAGLQIVSLKDDSIIKEREYDSDLERFYYLEDYKNYDINLKKFTGYITRQSFPTFRQKSNENDDLYSCVRLKIQNIMIGDAPYNPLRGNFRTFLYSPIDNEITMFFYRVNRERKHLVYDLDNVVGGYVQDNSRIKAKVEQILDELGNIIDKDERKQIVNFFVYADDNKHPYKFQHMPLVKLIGWKLYLEFVKL